MKNKFTFILSSALFLLAGCTTSLEQGTERIRMVTLKQKSTCEFLGIITADQQLDPYKASNSMNKVLNDDARRGANAVYLISQGRSGFDGAFFTV